ncbi:MAG: hypothetical protein AB1776_04130 [Bacillota bacterium]
MQEWELAESKWQRVPLGHHAADLLTAMLREDVATLGEMYGRPGVAEREIVQ